VTRFLATAHQINNLASNETEQTSSTMIAYTGTLICMHNLQKMSTMAMAQCGGDGMLITHAHNTLMYRTSCEDDITKKYTLSAEK
jgi:hypothetical protein